MGIAFDDEDHAILLKCTDCTVKPIEEIWDEAYFSVLRLASYSYDDRYFITGSIRRDASSKLLYNTDGNWTQSSLQGAIMVRPVFGKDPNPMSIPVVPESRFVLYPNPASNQVNIASEYGTLDGECFIYDCSGRLQFSGKAYKSIDVSQWNNGLYIVHVMRDTGPTTLRLVVSH